MTIKNSLSHTWDEMRWIAKRGASSVWYGRPATCEGGGGSVRERERKAERGRERKRARERESVCVGEREGAPRKPRSASARAVARTGACRRFAPTSGYEPSCSFQVTSLHARWTGLGFRVSGLGFWVSGFGSRVSGFGMHAPGLVDFLEEILQVTSLHPHFRLRALYGSLQWGWGAPGLVDFLQEHCDQLPHLRTWKGRCKATWKREFKLPWREAGPPNHHDDKEDSDQQVVNKELRSAAAPRRRVRPCF